MLKQFIGFVACTTASIVIAQTPGSASTPASGSPASKQASTDPAFGFMRERTPYTTSHDDFCGPSASTIPAHAMVVVVRKSPCVTKFGKQTIEFLEVLYAGKPRLVLASAVNILPGQQKNFDSIDPAQVEANAEDWKLASLLATKTDLDAAIKAYETASKQGLVLMKSGIFDVSEHTDGTGFRATVSNTGKKMIKYVTFNVTGLNAVGDPVRSLGRSGSAAVLRGIGPIEPGETASYSRDYMWHTDLVESFRINSVKLEFADGSSKLISDVKKIRVNEATYEMLTSDID